MISASGDKPSNSDDLFNVIELSSDYDNSTWFGKLVFLWQWRFFFRHYKKEIKLKDLPRGRAKDDADYVYNEFLKYWQAEVKRATKKGREPNLLYPIFKQYAFSLAFLTICCFLAQFATVSQALYLADIIRNFNDLNAGKADAQQEIIKICLIIVALSVVNQNFKNFYNYLSLLVSLRVRVCLSEMIYRKALRLSRNGLAQTSTGQIINFLSADLNKLDMFFNMFPYPLVGGALLVYIVASLWKTISYFTFFGLCFLLIVVPIQTVIGKIFSSMRSKATVYTDERIHLVNEFINAIKIIKLYCWEHPFAKKINEARKKEMAKYKKALYVFSITVGLFASSTKVVVFIILLTFYLATGSISAEIAFLVLSVFNQTLSLITILIPNCVFATLNFLISIRRFNKFLALEENSSEGVYHLDDQSEFSVSFRNVNACVNRPANDEGVDNPTYCDNESDQSNRKTVDILQNIDFSCKPGELVVVVGAVGSSKSSLLQAILSELQITEGRIEVTGRLAYAAQDAWIFSGSIRENILFGSEFDETKYNEVIRVCALERDLGIFEDGDQTLIGEKGISLSGGQKARIGLARALYLDADVLLLDDPLSAVDAHVSKHIFELAIKGYLRQKTVLLCTHQLNCIHYADKVLFLKDGKQILFDSGDEALRRLADEPNGEFAKFIGSNLGSEDDQQATRKRSLSTDSIAYEEDEEQQNHLKEIEKQRKEERMKEEDDKVNFVYRAYASYFSYGMIWLFGPLLVLAFGLTQLNATSLDYFLKLWMDSIDASKNSTAPVENDPVKDLIAKNAVYLYTGLIACFFVLTMVRIITLVTFTTKVSVELHQSLFNRIVRAKMKFFYTNPVGIILNRFSRDISTVDDQIWGTLYDFTEILTNDIVIYVVLAVANPFLMIPFSLFILAVIRFRVFYIRTARALETLEGVGKSPLIQHLASTLNGLSTVHAYQSEARFVQNFGRLQNDYSAVRLILITCKRWFVYVLETLQLIFVAGTLLVMILFPANFTGSLVGFILANVLKFTSEFQWGVQCWANLETSLCSVDRIETMGKNLDPRSTEGTSLSEPPLESTPDSKPPSDWPQRGEIEFRDVTLRYFSNETPALNKLNFKINEGEKVGIVGRTGAGKSSILAALFRLSDYNGEIILDGIDCKTIGLHDLRGKISIIPQESTLFTGTVRMNLDPLQQYTDQQLWDALRAVQLESVINELEGGLDSTVMSNGSNFSVGQKQLICLARAILKSSRILVMDEATANTDPTTDELIQATIRSVFKDQTILTIAHRINTIIDADRILVMDAGECREFDTPSRLLQDSGSLFSSMVDAYGEEQSKHLRRLVRQDA